MRLGLMCARQFELTSGGANWGIGGTNCGGGGFTTNFVTFFLCLQCHFFFEARKTNLSFKKELEFTCIFNVLFIFKLHVTYTNTTVQN